MFVDIFGGSVGALVLEPLLRLLELRLDALLVLRGQFAAEALVVRELSLERVDAVKSGKVSVGRKKR